MPQYLQDDETLSGRVDYLLDRVRRSPSAEERERYVAELRALESAAAIYSSQTIDLEPATRNILRGDERGLDPQDDVDQETVDYLVGVLDASYGGEAPVAVKANFLFHLTGEGEAVELTGAEFEVQADDPDDKLNWSKINASLAVSHIRYVGDSITVDPNKPNHFIEDALGDPATCTEDHNHPDPLPKAGPVGPTDSEGFDLDEDDEPAPISAAERLRQKTTKKKGK